MGDWSWGRKRAGVPSRAHWALEVAVVEASSVATIEGVAWMITVLVLVEVNPDWSVAA
jgi:hypothetical protein